MHSPCTLRSFRSFLFSFVSIFVFFFFFNDTATTEIYTLSLHDALPISPAVSKPTASHRSRVPSARTATTATCLWWSRSEEHTSELQSRLHLVCRLLLEKKKNKTNNKLVLTKNHR